MGDRSAESGWFLPGPKSQERIDRKWKKHYSGSGCDVHLGNGLLKRAECENALSKAGEGMNGVKRILSFPYLM